MRPTRLAILIAALLLAAPATPRPSAQTPTVTAQLDRYLRGEHDGVVAELGALKDFDDVLEQLRREGPAWIERGGASERPWRQLAAATYALEAARAADHVDWKWVQRVVIPGIRAAEAIWWKAPPLLIEWACELMRQERAPRPIERIWHLAAIAVAQHRSDYEFLIGSPWQERGEPKDEIEHLAHAMKRFPKEPRLLLAQAIAIEWRTWEGSRSRRGTVRNLKDAIAAFREIRDDPSVGGEASMRLGALQLRGGFLKDALESFERVETSTRDPHVIYLARYFKGQALERSNRAADAERAYAGALAALPQAQSATMALSALLFKIDRLEAAELVDTHLATRPQPIDPWRVYVRADDRFWPELIARLREEIAR